MHDILTNEIGNTLYGVNNMCQMLGVYFFILNYNYDLKKPKQSLT